MNRRNRPIKSSIKVQKGKGIRMRKNRKIKGVISIICMASILFTGCSKTSIDSDKVVGEDTKKNKIQVVTTLFPQYDFTNEIGKDSVNVKMLLKPGVESHSYEPSPSDIVAINKADLFLYTGDEMEPWVTKILDSIDGDVKVVNLSEHIDLDKVEDNDLDEHGHEHVEEADSHDDENNEETDNHNHEAEDKEEEHNHVHTYDPHIWTNPLNAKIMVNDIAEALSEVDPDNQTMYEENAKQYNTELQKLDQDITDTVQNAVRNEVVFGGRFAFHYFFKQYGLTYVAAYDSCSANSEPSAKTIANIIDKVKEDNIPVIFYEEFANPKVANSIAQATGAKTLLLHSCHNVSTDDYKAGSTYLSLMRQNLENLKEALN